MSVREMTDGWYIYTDQIPNLLLALLVLFIGWLVAKGIGKGVAAALKKTSLDNKLFSDFGKRKYSIEFIIGKIVYYTLLIVVWIIFFNMLHLSLIAEPLVKMVSIMTAAIPNLLKAALILLFAWVVAILLRLLFKKGAAMFHLERKLVKWKMTNSELEAGNKVNSVSKAIFYFVLLLFLPGVLGALQMEGISEPFSNALSTILAFIPKLFAAALIVFIGWLIAKIVRDILTNFLKSTGTDNLGQRFGLIKNVEETSLSSMIGNIVFILILIPTIITALEKLELRGIADPAIAMLQEVLALIPNIAVAIILLLVGIWLGKWVERMVTQMLWRLKLDSVFTSDGDRLINLRTTEVHPVSNRRHACQSGCYFNIYGGSLTNCSFRFLSYLGNRGHCLSANAVCSPFYLRDWFIFRPFNRACFTKYNQTQLLPHPCGYSKIYDFCHYCVYGVRSTRCCPFHC